ncbi:MAG: hypothetical protein ACFBSD_13740 [Paracoccaceae bacterium]
MTERLNPAIDRFRSHLAKGAGSRVRAFLGLARRDGAEHDHPKIQTLHRSRLAPGTAPVEKTLEVERRRAREEATRHE